MQKSFWRFGPAIAGAFAFLLSLVPLSLAPAAATEWPKTDIAPDPAVRQGVLPNGMRYAILKNGTPAGAVSVRFSVAVGSTHEETDQRGFSHFVEHMAFRGSKNFPDGELNRTLERVGLRFGADTNATTGQDMTSYMFNLPDTKGLSEALAITRDIAGNVSFDPKAVESEAGVVISESQLRGDPGRRAGTAEMQFELLDPRAAATPGSEPSIIKNPSAAALLNYYRIWYRPERAVLTVVGDVDPDVLAKDIAALFADWKGAGQGAADPIFKVPTDRGLQARVHTEAGAPARLVFSWVKPALAHPVDRAQWSRLHIQGVALQIANRRLAAMAAEAELPFTGASAGERDAHRAATLYSLAVNLGDNWRRALTFLAAARQSLLDTPITQGEIDSVVTAQKAAAQRAEAAADTRTTPGLANFIAANAIQGDVWVSPAQFRAVLDQDLTGLAPDAVGAALKTMFAGDPLIFVSSRDTVEGGEAAVLQTWRSASTDIRARPASMAVAAWPYTDFGQPGRVMESSNAPDLGVTVLRFSNNVRLLVRPSHTRVNQVLVAVRLGNGRLGLTKDSAVPNWLFGGLVPGGLGALSSNQIVTSLSGKSYGAGFAVGDSAFGFGGQTTPDDLQTQLQIMAAYIKDPGFRAAGFEQFRQQSVSRLRTADATASGSMGLNVPPILHGGDKRWGSPSIAQAEAAKIDDLKALAVPAFADGPMEVVIAGDITVEAASRAVAATLGALPTRSSRNPKVTPGNDVSFPGGVAPVVLPTSSLTATGQTLVNMSWATRGYFFASLKEETSLRLLAAIMRERLLESVRGQGLSYSVQVSTSASSAFDYGYLSAIATMPAGKADVFYEAAGKIIAELKAGEIGADAFERARTPTLQDFRRGIETNDYWLGLLNSGWELEPKFERARGYGQVLESVTVADIAEVARRYLTDARLIKISAGF
jgi:zinc protease